MFRYNSYWNSVIGTFMPGFRKTSSRFLAHRKPFMADSFRRKVGYSYLGPFSRDVDKEVSLLRREGCHKIFQDISTSVRSIHERPQLDLALKNLRYGDQLILLTLSSLGSNYSRVVNSLHCIHSQGIEIRSIDGLIDTSKIGNVSLPIISLLYGLLSLQEKPIYAEPNRNIDEEYFLVRNTGGRPRTSPIKERLVIRLRQDGFSYRAIREQTGLALSTIRRIIVEQQ